MRKGRLEGSKEEFDGLNGTEHGGVMAFGADLMAGGWYGIASDGGSVYSGIGRREGQGGCRPLVSLWDTSAGKTIGDWACLHAIRHGTHRCCWNHVCAVAHRNSISCFDAPYM